MITKEAAYKKAFENINQSLKEKQAKREIMLNAAYKSNARLSEIDRELAVIGAKLAVDALAYGADTVEKARDKSEALAAEKKLLLKKAQVPEITYNCDICKDSGRVSGKICECVKREAAAVIAEALSREMPLESCRFDNFDLSYYPDATDEKNQNPRRRMTSILNLCRDYVSTFNPQTSKNLLFTGDSGLGKTHLTLSIVSGVIEKGYLPIYGSAENLFSAVEAERFSGEGRGNYDALLNCDLLVIDDLGAEHATAFTKSVLYNFINTRILTGKPTVINTNLTMKQLEERYTPRVSSRLIGNYEGHRFIGRDIRQQKSLECSG